MKCSQFGGKITKILGAQYAKSSHWDGSKFLNLEETSMGLNYHDLPSFLRKQFCEKENREPSAPLPIQPFSGEAFLKPSRSFKFVWYGHSVILLRLNGKTLLVDPMFGSNAAPISPFPVRRYSENTLAIIDELPDIDLVLLTHDHYDHLDYDSIQKLLPKSKRFFVPLGVGRHLREWGISEGDVREFDWWEAGVLDDINVIFTPSRHFSGRGLKDRSQSLWGGWTLATERERIWFSGDGGYGKHFQEIGSRLGPFDFAFMECGQYNENWHELHMYPEESVQASIDAKASVIMPIHWAAFTLAQHSWTEPVNRFVAEARLLERSYITPRLGELVTVTDTIAQSSWW